MILRVLGCSGSEAPGEHHCSFLIDAHVLLDMGSAASLLTLAEQRRISDIFLSHAHLDHTKDLGFFAESVLGSGAKPVRVRATEATIDRVREHLLNGEIWPDFTRLPSVERPVLRYEPIESGSTVRVGELDARPFPVEHMPGSVGFEFTSPTGRLICSGDTAPAGALWGELSRAAGSLKAILVEVSFPNRLQALADASRHLTPGSLQEGLERLDRDVPVYAYHLKAPTREETLRDLERVDGGRVLPLQAEMQIEF